MNEYTLQAARTVQDTGHHIEHRWLLSAVLECMLL